MLADMESAPAEFRPTNFWSSGLTRIIEDIETLGLDGFRTHPSAAFFYVPLYASNTLRKRGRWLMPLVRRLPARKRARMMRRLTRSDRAFLDYRIYRATEVAGGLPLDQVSESDVGGGERFAFDGRSYSRSMLNYLRALNLYKRHTDSAGLQSCLESGGGYGTLGEILLKANPEAFFVNVDIPPVAAVSTYYLGQVFGAENVLSYRDSRTMEVIDLDDIRRRYKAAVLCPWQLPRVRGQVDLFANFMSFQEMEPEIVRNYVTLVQPLIARHVLMRNTAVGKRVARKEGDVGVIRQVRSDFVQSCFAEFRTIAKDSFVYGETNETGTYDSEVVVMERHGPAGTPSTAAPPAGTGPA
ncbi:putative sugar O-methyltransferase [Rhodovulum euryhalinum]|nr:putative sugar O-methyltransferase [Rhodovulum euryhalinum]